MNRIRVPFRKLFYSTLILIWFSTSLFSQRKYVNHLATGLNNGNSWQDAYVDLKTAIDNQDQGSIWVAQGIYTPTNTNNQTISFSLKTGLSIYGGFAGNEVNLNQRDISENPTILSGNIGLPDSDMDNSYAVLRNYEGGTLNGFIIQEGNAILASSASHSFGGGCQNHSSSFPIFRNCTFRNNSSLQMGGAVYDDNSNSEYHNCRFINNHCDDLGGAIYLLQSTSTFYNSHFELNSSGKDGGGLAIIDSDINFENCFFINNQATEKGGSIFNFQSELLINDAQFIGNNGTISGGIHCESGAQDKRLIVNNSYFVDNTYYQEGAAIYAAGFSQTDITNCFFYGNKGLNVQDQGAAISLFDGVHRIESSTFGNNHIATERSNSTLGNLYIMNCIYWGNDEEIVSPVFFRTNVSFSIVQGGYSGPGNVDENPSFVDENNIYGPDGILKTEDDGCMITQSSPAVNAGYPYSTFPYSDIMLCPRVDTIDIGAYEAPCLLGQVYFVDLNANGTSSGQSWENADQCLSHAILVAEQCKNIREIWVKSGVYHPKDVSDYPDPIRKYHTFNLPRNIAIYGGFEGTENHISQRDIAMNETILSGDFYNNDIISGSGNNLVIHNNIENAYTVITVYDGQSESSILDGFTIKGGNSDYEGGGLFCEYSSATIRNCTFTGNNAYYFGGGIYNGRETNLVLINCSFNQNAAYLGESIYNEFGGQITIGAPSSN